MSRIVEVRHTTRLSNRGCLGMHCFVFCPGCDEIHELVFDCHIHATTVINNPFTDPLHSEDTWVIHKPTTSPGTRPETKCEFRISNGHFIYSPACRHALANQTIPMQPLPKWSSIGVN